MMGAKARRYEGVTHREWQRETWGRGIRILNWKERQGPGHGRLRWLKFSWLQITEIQVTVAQAKGELWGADSGLTHELQIQGDSRASERRGRTEEPGRPLTLLFPRILFIWKLLKNPAEGTECNFPPTKDWPQDAVSFSKTTSKPHLSS